MAYRRSLSYKHYLSFTDGKIPRETARNRRQRGHGHDNEREEGVQLITESNELSYTASQGDESFDQMDADDGGTDDCTSFTASIFDDETGTETSSMCDEVVNDSIPNGDELLYADCSITKGQLFTLVFAYILRHLISEVAISDLIALFNTVVPGCLPKTTYYFKKLLDCRIKNNIETHVYCDTCGTYLAKVDGSQNIVTCPDCESTAACDELVKKGKSYLVYPLEKQLRVLFETTDIKYHIVREIDARDGSICDLTDGSEYRKMNVNFPDSLTLLCNTDGVPVFNSSNSSLWPVYFSINELPISIRRLHMLLAALWLGTCKPQIDTLFTPIISSLEHLAKDGFQWLCDGREITTRVFMCLVSCDSVARPLLQNIKQFNGKFGCSFCLHEGKVVPKGRGFTRVYTQALHEHVNERTHNGMLMDAEVAVSQNMCVNGVKGPSILSVLSNFDMVRGFFPDYMHAVLLGVVRQFVFIWFDSAYHLKPYYIGRNMNEVDDILSTIKPPSEIKRMPRSIQERKYWKASEWRNFLLFYSFVCVKHLLPRPYLHHWYLLMFSVYKLLRTPITIQDIADADVALHKFVALTADLYGSEHVTFNVHLLTHLATYVQRWGPLWSNSAFQFEDCNGKLLSFFHGTRGVNNQIFRAFIGASQLKLLARTYFTALDCADIFMQLTSVASVYKTAVKLSDDVTVLGHPFARKLTVDEVIAIENLLGSSHICNVNVSVFQRAIVHGKLLTTKSYSDSIKTQDCYINVAGIPGTLQLLRVCVVKVCHELSCENHKAVDNCILLCNKVDHSTVRNVDTEVSVNVTAHIAAGVIGNLIAVPGNSVRDKVFALTDNTGKMYCITLPRFETE